MVIWIIEVWITVGNGRSKITFIVLLFFPLSDICLIGIKGLASSILSFQLFFPDLNWRPSSAGRLDFWAWNFSPFYCHCHTNNPVWFVYSMLFSDTLSWKEILVRSTSQRFVLSCHKEQMSSDNVWKWYAKNS